MYIKKKIPWGEDIIKEDMWMLDIDYITQNNWSSKLRIIVSYAIVSSYMIYVKYPHKFYHMV